MYRKITIAFLLILTACAKKAPLPADKMTAVMTDVMLMESGNAIRYNYGILPGHFWQKEYLFVLKKHQVDTAQFRQAVNWYQAHPEQFSKVMEKVITRLQKMQVKRQTEMP